MMKTRGKGAGKPPANVEAPSNTTTKTSLAPEAANPPKLFVLPKDVSADARITTLKNPRYGTDCRYLICPGKGIFEFNKISPPKTTPRSWLLSRDVVVEGEKGASVKSSALAKGYVMRNADLFIATAMDPLFFLLPALVPTPVGNASESQKRNFLSVDDHLDNVIAESTHLSSFVKEGSLRHRFEERLASICDTVDAGDETMYRLQEEKLLGEILSKARTMVKHGLPASMEEKLIRKALEPPLLSIKREESSATVEEVGVIDADGPPSLAEEDTQSSMPSTVTTASFLSEASTGATSFTSMSVSQEISVEVAPEANKAPQEVVELLRLRTAISFLYSNYLPPHLSSTIKNLLTSPDCGVDFAPLDEHLADLAKLRKEAHAARSVGDFSRKRSMNEDEESEIRAEKKRKLEEEKRKKAGESRGVKQLKKVNVTGMKKMSDFFKKK